eukprot:GILJ01007350.1.p1 GENE.GILJ01007350.1~~GILJ01007350.1.p1  ORF type:complete len:588 (+),score=100.10 GILJ01007350.1:3-1766(+)
MGDTMSPLRGVIFDLGQTLMKYNGGQGSDYKKDARKKMFSFLQENGYLKHLPIETFLSTIRQNWEKYEEAKSSAEIQITASQILKETLCHLGVDVTDSLVDAAMEAGADQTFELWDLIDGAEDVVRQLHSSGVRLALVTNAADTRKQERIIDRSGLRAYFDIIIVSAAVGIRKPNPDIFQRVLNHWQFQPSEVAAIGDMLDRDVLCGNRVGIKTIWFLSEHTDKAENASHVGQIKPDLTIVSLCQLPSALAAIESGLSGMRVGYHFNLQKVRKLLKEGMLDSNSEITFVPIDSMFAVEAQGPFDAVVMKVTDLMAQARQDDSARQFISDLQSFLANHPKIRVIDPLDKVGALLDRGYLPPLVTEMQRLLQGSSATLRAPRCLVLDSIPSDPRDVITRNGLAYPVIVKTVEACGSSCAHEMAVIFNGLGVEDVMKTLPFPLMFQEYVNHSATLYKVYVLGDLVHLMVRPSIPDAPPAFLESAHLSAQPVLTAFNSQKAFPTGFESASESTLNQVPTPNSTESINSEAVRRIAAAISECMGLTIFGFDLIIEARSGDYLLIDVNYFPSFRELDNFPSLFKKHILNMIKQ